MHDAFEGKRAEVKAGRAGAGRAARRDAMRPLGVAIAFAEKPLVVTMVRSRRLQSLYERARVDEKRSDNEEEKKRAKERFRRRPSFVITRHLL